MRQIAKALQSAITDRGLEELVKNLARASGAQSVVLAKNSGKDGAVVPACPLPDTGPVAVMKRSCLLDPRAGREERARPSGYRPQHYRRSVADASICMTSAGFVLDSLTNRCFNDPRVQRHLPDGSGPSTPEWLNPVDLVNDALVASVPPGETPRG